LIFEPLRFKDFRFLTHKKQIPNNPHEKPLPFSSRPNLSDVRPIVAPKGIGG